MSVGPFTRMPGSERGVHYQSIATWVPVIAMDSLWKGRNAYLPKGKERNWMEKHLSSSAQTLGGAPGAAPGGPGALTSHMASSRMESPPAQSEPSNDETGQIPALPASYGEDRVTLLVRDPFWVYAYWEFASTPAEGSGEQRLLRLFQAQTDGSGNQRIAAVIDMPISGAVADWYVNVPKANALYFAEIGFMDSHGQFRCIARSNWVHTPPDAVSSVVDEEWMSLDWASLLYGWSEYSLSGSEELLAARSWRTAESQYVSSPFAAPGSARNPTP